jgi:hypothetical protein
MRITLVGLSNYIIDSAKLNRGILIVRDQLTEDAQQQTAREIFASTAEVVRRAVKAKVVQADDKINEATKKYHAHVTSGMNVGVRDLLGLRDFYGFIRNLANVYARHGHGDVARIAHVIARNFSGAVHKDDQFRKILLELFHRQSVPLPDTVMLVRENIAEDWGGMRSPLMRHVILVTVGMPLMPLHLEALNVPAEPVVIYAYNFSGLTADEHVSNDLRRLAQAMAQGSLVIFVGYHRCFDSLYDVFNLRFQTLGRHSYALSSSAGDSYPIRVHERFRVIVIVDQTGYPRLPAPFLNRFEKLPFDYSTLVPQSSAGAVRTCKQWVDKHLSFISAPERAAPYLGSRQRSATRPLGSVRKILT